MRLWRKDTRTLKERDTGKMPWELESYAQPVSQWVDAAGAILMLLAVFVLPIVVLVGVLTK